MPRIMESIKCDICSLPITEAKKKCHIKLNRAYAHSKYCDMNICQDCFYKIENNINAMKNEPIFKYGKWQYNPHRPSYHAYMCSACGRCSGEKKPFCPNCGKEMITEDLNKL